MGYLIIDHRACDPAIKREYGGLQEFDTASCCHCQAVLKIIKRQTEGAFCFKCNGPVCNTDACAIECVPFRKKLEEQLARQRLLSQIEGL